MTIELPTARTEPESELLAYTILCYGEKKIGKTSLFSSYERAFYAMFEPGGKALRLFQKPMTSWSVFRKYVKLLLGNDDFDVIVVDTIDLAYDRCMDYVCRKRGIDHPSDEGYGKGWKAVRREFVKVISDLAISGKGIVFISHSVDRDIKPKAGAEYVKTMPTMSGQCADVVEALVDIWMYYGYDSRGNRIMQIRGTTNVSAGHRLEEDHFHYSDGKRINIIPAGGSEKEAWENFMLAFNNELPPPEPSAGRKKKSKTSRKAKTE